ncbi:hypothetical protein BsWGS_27308 [Bradybaena similaris]
MDSTQTFRNDSDSGSELSVDLDDSWFSYQNEVFDGNSMEGRFVDESESDTGADEVMAGPEGDCQAPRRGCGQGRGIRECSDTCECSDTQFEWELFPDEDLYEQDWLNQFERNNGPNVDLLQGMTEPLEYFKIFFLESLIDMIVTETNRYPHDVLDAGRDTYRKKCHSSISHTKLKALGGKINLLQFCFSSSTLFLYVYLFNIQNGRHDHMTYASF